MIHDVVNFINAPVRMLGTGWVASAGALIYCAAKRENRFCLPNTRFLLHEPRGGVGGMASDVEIQAREILRMRERLNRIFAEATGQPIDKIKKRCRPRLLDDGRRSEDLRPRWPHREQQERYSVASGVRRAQPIN